MPFNNIPCPELTMVTNLLIKPKSNKGVFIFTPDLLSQPSMIHPLDLNVSANVRGDIKLVLLDDNQSPLFTLVLKCSQYDIKDLDETDAIPDAVKFLYKQIEYTQIVSIGTSYLSLLSEYVELEETAYLYRQVSQSYLSLWRTSNRRNGIMQYIIRKTNEIVDKLPVTEEQSDYSSYIWCLSQTFLRSRILGLRQMGNDNQEFFDTNLVESTNQHFEI